LLDSLQEWIAPMQQAELIVGTATLLVLIVGPSILGLAGLWRAHCASVSAVSDRISPWKLGQTINSAVLYALSFNLIFFIQELFLVLPKAFIPGIRPTLFHNNHTWTGQNPLAHLFQGTGALAIFLVAIACALLLRCFSARSSSVRLFLIWMAYNGCLQSLPQVIIGSVEPENDVGMAMDYLHLEAPAKAAAALVALIAIAVAALWLRRPLLSLAESPADIANSRARTIFMFRVATLPAVTAILLIIPFRIPREFTEVVLVPVIVTVIGIAWLQAGAWAISNVKMSGRSSNVPSRYAIGGLVMLLFIFQCLLRPGIRFY
jgi:hypothetical protein